MFSLHANPKVDEEVIKPRSSRDRSADARPLPCSRDRDRARDHTTRNPTYDDDPS
ncbi:hypothetical protein AKJ09_03809 [Labilithrix luteola]|uniref:Uncharacterized protein n=1 Tax=Labilithrix luteola TaxID=1391654 RepID=A0A0K1PUD1_9BACT|nr:hypothetical protein AKJ09_03809 [Labilithrix luteola]